jgi:hypothetical protein
MEQTAIKAGAPPSPSPIDTSAAFTAERPRPLTRVKPLPIRCLEVLASLRLTVILFTLSIFLVYFGTWAQKDASIWAVVNQYFRSFYVWIPFKVLLMYSVDDVGGSIPYPGGWLLGGLLLINLLAAHAVRFKISWKRSGILLIHSGLILMMVGELVTGLYAVEGHMFIMEGNSANFVEHDRSVELAIIDRSDAKMDRETIIPGKLLERKGGISNSELPFDVEVVDFMPNSEILDFGWQEPGQKIPNNPATAGIGVRRLAKLAPPEAGVDTKQKGEFPSVYVTLKEKGTGKVMGTYLLSILFSYMQTPLDEVVVDGKRYEFSLRFQRDYRDYSLQLIRFDHDKYIGTDKARNFSSLVNVKDTKAIEQDKTGRQVLIYMNHPLYFQGETLYQANLHHIAKGTVLQVVRNPGWRLPYISFILVCVGMLVHFGLHLVSFLRRGFAK